MKSSAIEMNKVYLVLVSGALVRVRVTGRAEPLFLAGGAGRRSPPRFKVERLDSDRALQPRTAAALRPLPVRKPVGPAAIRRAAGAPPAPVVALAVAEAPSHAAIPCGRGTLDALSPAAFEAEVGAGIALTQADPGKGEELALSYGL